MFNPFRSKRRVARRYEVGDDILEFRSKLTSKDYELYLSIPTSYERDETRFYPVLYLLDGLYDFSLVENLYYNLLWDKVIDKCFIVGISYGYDASTTKKLRFGDLLPVSAGGPPPGAEVFAESIKTELIPFIETRFRIDGTRRILGGSSFGALFTMYAIFALADTFAAHIAMSPPIGWGGKHIFSIESAFARSNEHLPKNVWYCVGGLEAEDYIDDARSLYLSLQSRNYAGLNLSFNILEGEKHAGAKAEGFNRSLRYVFERFRASKQPERLANPV